MTDRLVLQLQESRSVGDDVTGSLPSESAGGQKDKNLLSENIQSWKRGNFAATNSIRIWNSFLTTPIFSSWEEFARDNAGPTVDVDLLSTAENHQKVSSAFQAMCEKRKADGQGFSDTQIEPEMADYLLSSASMLRAVESYEQSVDAGSAS